ncbi:MAG TPA: hypothetical protein ENG62_03370 [Thermoplasmatales archaeon]|nr:hypothetical protein [Thermoplasmatales archaeon]
MRENLEQILRELPQLDEECIAEYIDEAVEILKNEKAFIERDNSLITFIGDIHGDFETTKAIIDQFLGGGILVFLGDYIDREPMEWGALYTITYLVILKTLYPRDIILLKGNHECNYIIPCYPYEFKWEIIQRFGSPELHEKFVELFSHLPVVFKGNNIIAAHGGILKNGSIDTLRKLDKNDASALVDLVWSDPALSPVDRGIGEKFNENDLKTFLRNTESTLFIRGHDYHLLGISIYGDRCLTIFSSQRYMNMGNGGILVAQSKGKISSIDELLVKDYSSGKWVDYRVRRMR